MQMDSAPHHQMECTIELRSLNSISVPNLVSIAESFLKPKDPGQKVFRPWRVQLAPHTNGTPKDFKLVRYACDLRVWGRWCPAFDLYVRAIFFFLASLDGAARATCHVLLIDPKTAPSSFQRIDESNGASPVTIGPAVLALFTKVLGHTNFISQNPQPNSFQPTHYA